MNLRTQVESWLRYWQTVRDAEGVERTMRRLRWLEDFAFHCGSAIGVQEYRALRIQIEAGEKKLAELRGDAVAVMLPLPEQPEWVNR